MHATLVSALSLFAIAEAFTLRNGASPHSRKQSRCPPFKGDFVIHQYQLYPENADFDFISCRLYTGNLWNSTVGVYDPYKGRYIETLEFPGITRNPEFHIGGVAADPRSGLLSIVVDAGEAFNSLGANISGTNYIMQWDPKTRKLLYKTNLTALSQGRYGGPQDVEHDPLGNTYTLWTFSSSLTKTDKKGKTSEWYLTQPFNTTGFGFSGFASKGWLLLVSDSMSGGLFRFDMSKKKGVPKPIPITPKYGLLSPDAAYLPPRYHGTVLLVAQLFNGTAVYESKNGKWDKARYKGSVPIQDTTFVNTFVVQVGSSVYQGLIPPGFAGDPVVPGQLAGNRTDFPFPDITKEVDALLGW